MRSLYHLEYSVEHLDYSIMCEKPHICTTSDDVLCIYTTKTSAPPTGLMLTSSLLTWLISSSFHYYFSLQDRNKSILLTKGHIIKSNILFSFPVKQFSYEILLLKTQYNILISVSLC